MIELRTLGSLDLRRQDGSPVDAVLRQPKRLALLVYLALASPQRFQRRDTLLGYFWPDLDQEHARASLRRALYFLRRAVGDQVVIGRGEEEVGIDAGTFWSDAGEFELRLDAGQATAALELYQGDLLAGFYISGAPAVERWLDGERSRLRDRASKAAWSLADGASSPSDRVHWARRAAALTPTDESALLRLVAILDQAGDRAEALRACDDFVRRLGQEFDLEPGESVTATINALRRTRPQPVTPVATVSTHPGLIAVLPFAVHGSADLTFLAEGMVDLLSTALDGAGDITTVDPRAMLGVVRSGEGLDPAQGWQVARHFGAGRFVLGSIVSAGGRLQAVATIYDAALRPLIRAEAKRVGEAELFELVDDLVRQLLAGGERAPANRLIKLAALTTTSVPALKHYLLGEGALRLGRYLEAIDAFQQAVRVDDSFALAHFRLAAALAASVMIVPAREAIAHGWRHRGRLSERDRLLLAAQRAWLLGQTAEAERQAASLVALHPEDVEGWFLLGDLTFHSNPVRGRSAALAREPFERALALDPGHMGALVHLVRIAALEGRVADVDSMVARAETLSPSGDQALGIRALGAWLGNDAARREQVLAQIPPARVLAAGTAFADLSVYARDLAGAELFWSHCMAAARSDQLKAMYHILGSSVAFARGRRRAAGHYLDAAAGLDPDSALIVRAALQVTAEPPLPPAELIALRQKLLDWDTGAARDASLPFPIHEGLYGHLRCYLLGLLEASQGDGAAMSNRLEDLAELDVPAGAEALIERLGRTMEAVALRDQGRTREALAVLEGAASEVWFQLAIASPFYAGGYERMVRADLLLQLGRLDEAMGWLATIAQRSPFETPYLAGAERRMIRIAELRGDGRSAEHHRTRLAALLREADSS